MMHTLLIIIQWYNVIHLRQLLMKITRIIHLIKNQFMQMANLLNGKFMRKQSIKYHRIILYITLQLFDGTRYDLIMIKG